MEITVDEIAMLLGKRDIEIYHLTKEVAALKAEIQRLQEPRPSA